MKKYDFTLEEAVTHNDNKRTDAKRHGGIVGFVGSCFGKNHTFSPMVGEGGTECRMRGKFFNVHNNSSARKNTTLTRIWHISSPEARVQASCAKRTVKNLSLFTSHFSREGKRYAFTLAETLITLGIIGVVAALTLPPLVQNYKKSVVETRLKHSYSLLNQVVNFAQSDFGEIDSWDLSKGVQSFVETYLLPYMKSEISSVRINNNRRLGDYYTLQLSNGSQWIVNRYYVYEFGYYFVCITVDINGSAKPNARGIDRFDFYIFPKAQNIYNTGNGDCARNVPNAGVYYDGYGFSDANLKNYYYRGCAGKDVVRTNGYPNNCFCVGLIVRNGWKIPKDYPLKF